MTKVIKTLLALVLTVALAVSSMIWLNRTSRVSASASELPAQPVSYLQAAQGVQALPAVKASPAAEDGLVDTLVVGVPRKINASAQNELKRTVTVFPASPARKVRLQQYRSEAQDFVTVATYKTEAGDSAEVELSFPKKFRRRTTGVWRIKVEKTKTAREYVSRPFTLISRNLKKLNLNAKSACVYCVETGEVLFGKKMNEERAMASTTKVMTAVLLLESGKLGKTVKISKAAAGTRYGNLHMKAGDVYRNKDLLYAAMLPSSNDAANALSEAVSKKTSVFVDAMNEKAAALGLQHTHFANPHGLDAKGHYSTAKEMAKLTAYAGKDETFVKVIGTAKYSFKSRKYHKKHKIESTDPMKDVTGHIGGKTGYTKQAKQCLVSLYTYGERTYAVCVFGCTWRADRRADMEKIYRYIDRYGNTEY